MSGSGTGGSGGAGTGDVVRQGHLKKLKTMKKKFFVLRAESAEESARLEYYESEKKFRAGATPRRVMSLKSCYNIMRRLDLKQRHVIAMFTREEQFCIVADNEQELHAWLAAILKHHRSDEASGELLHPIQHVWQVNVQKKGLGAVKNVHGLYNLCLTDKTLTLVKIKSHNNVISELGIPERVEYSLKNIRRCGDSECFFYMEVGRQTTTGAGELWMLSEDSNIAQSMHSTIYHAMRNCAKETENERDHIVLPKGDGLPPARRQTYSDGRGRAGLTDAGTLRNRCDSMPSRACSSFEIERPPLRHNDLEGVDVSRDEPDAAEWYRTPRIPEEPDVCDISRELLHLSLPAGGAGAASADSDGYLRMAALDAGELSLEPGRVSSSASVCSGTPSTDPRFSEYQLEPATSHIAEWRPPRAYSVGSRPAPRAEARHRAYSVGARARPAPPAHRDDDLMLLDFSQSSPSKTATPPLSRTPPASLAAAHRARADEYVCMSPRAGYEPRPAPAPPAAVPAAGERTPEGYVEMSFGRAPTRPIAIAAPPRVGAPVSASPDESACLSVVRRGSAIFEFSGSLESPLSPAVDLDDDDTTHKLDDEIIEDEEKPSGSVSCSPHYVTLAPRALSDEEPSPVAGAAFSPALHYAALDLEPRRLGAPLAPAHYTQIDFQRSEKLHAADA